MSYPDFPLPVGIFRQVDAPIYEQQVHAQQQQAKEKFGAPNLEKLLYSGEMWDPAANPQVH